MKFLPNKFIVFLLCAGLLFKYAPCNAQQQSTDSTWTKGDGIALAVISGVVVVILVARYIKKNSSKDFRKFKHEISNIDNLIANKSTVIKNRNNIRLAFSTADRYYSQASSDSHANKTKLAERAQYFNKQKQTFSGYLKEYYEPQYKTLKEQFFEDVAKNNSDEANNALQKIKTLVNEWKAMDESVDRHYREEEEVSTMNKILSTAFAIKKVQTETFDRMNALSNY